MVKKFSTSSISLKYRILLAFFIILLIGGVSTNIIFQHILNKTLTAEGLHIDMVNNIRDYFSMIGFLITFAGSMILLFIAFYISDSFTRPIKQLTNGLIELAKGKWQTRVAVSSRDEIGQLAEGINFMAESVEKALDRLEKAKEYTDNIIVSVPSILIILNNKLEVLSSNIAFEKLSENFPSLTLKDFIRPLEEEIKTNMANGETFKKEISISPENSGIKLIFSATISSIGHEDGVEDSEAARVLLSITDVTERKKMKELFLQSKQDWEDTFNTIPDAITIHDQEYNIVYANTAAQKMLRLTNSTSYFYNKCFKAYHGEESPPKGCPSCNCLQTGMPVTFETYEPHLGKYIELRSIPRLNDDKEVIGLIHIVRDISERKKIEEKHNKLLVAVTKAKLEWELTFNSVNEFILFIDKELHITRCNKSFSEYAGLPENDIIGHKCYDFFPCSREYLEDIQKGIRDAHDIFSQKEILTESGRWLYISHRPVNDENGDYAFSVILATDITEQKNAQKRIEESKAELKKRVNDLERFYNMAVGRELKMRKLKREINMLKAKLEKYQNGALELSS